jgi:hypothetical protein
VSLCHCASSLFNYTFGTIIEWEIFKIFSRKSSVARLSYSSVSCLETLRGNREKRLDSQFPCLNSNPRPLRNANLEMYRYVSPFCRVEDHCSLCGLRFKQRDVTWRHAVELALSRLDIRGNLAQGEWNIVRLRYAVELVLHTELTYVHICSRDLYKHQVLPVLNHLKSVNIFFCRLS